MTKTRSTWGPLCLVLLAACSAPPAPSAVPGEDSAPPASSADPLLKIKICLESICNSDCATEPGVAGGSCESNTCVCDAPTCGAFDQAPCAGHYCSQGHYDAWLGWCDDCGTSQATCCDYEHAGATTSCYGDLICQNGFECVACGSIGEVACQPAGVAPYCNSGVLALEGAGSAGATPGLGTPVCASACGGLTSSPGQSSAPTPQLPCAVGGCTGRDTVLLDGYCQWDPDCGHDGQQCCSANSSGYGDCLFVDLPGQDLYCQACTPNCSLCAPPGGE
jgi:hypothetical protein